MSVGVWKLYRRDDGTLDRCSKQHCEITELLLEVNPEARWSAATCNSYLEVPLDTLTTIPLTIAVADWNQRYLEKSTLEKRQYRLLRR